jgi:hypothetical protein
MIKLMVKESILLGMERYIKDLGLKIKGKAKGDNNGQMVQYLKDYTKIIRRMV